MTRRKYQKSQRQRDKEFKRSQEIEALYRSGLTPKQIIEDYGYYSKTVYATVKSIPGYPLHKHTKTMFDEHPEYENLYGKWSQMNARCYRKTAHNYKWYGGKGVRVCDEWRESFEEFAKWCIEQGYEKGMAISRFGDVGNYEPNNCKIVTMLENSEELIEKYGKAVRIYKDDFEHIERSINKMARWLINNGYTRTKNQNTVQANVSNKINGRNGKSLYGFNIELVED